MQEKIFERARLVDDNKNDDKKNTNKFEDQKSKNRQNRNFIIDSFNSDDKFKK